MSKPDAGWPICPQHLVAEARKDHPLDCASAGQVLPDGFYSDIRSFVERVAEYPRADGRISDALTTVVFGELQG